MRWKAWGWVLLGALVAPLAAQDDDESVIEIEEAPEAEPRPKRDDAGGKFEPVPSRAADAEVELTAFVDGRKSFRLQRPVDWRLRESRSSERESVYQIYVPGAKLPGRLRVTDRYQGMNPRSGPTTTRRSNAGKKGVTDFAIHARPIPHATYTLTERDRTWRYVHAFVRARGRTTELMLATTSDVFDTAFRDFLASLTTFESMRAEWPAVTKDYAVRSAGRLKVAVHKEVATKTTSLFKTIKQAQRACDRAHGTLPRPPNGEKAPLVYVHAHRADEAGLVPRLGNVDTKCSICFSGLALFVLLEEKEWTRELASELSFRIGEFNAMYRWGDEVPQWVRTGEGAVTRAESMSGKKLPLLERVYWNWTTEPNLPTLAEMPALLRQEGSWDRYYKAAFCYVAFFRAGPRKSRKAYRSYLSDIEKNLDYEKAAREHLEPLGYEKIKSEMSTFLIDGLKPFEKKE
ncbi:MAG: hypothetical protein AAGD14_19290 [Planctomycetota bacterium]